MKIFERGVIWQIIGGVDYIAQITGCVYNPSLLYYNSNGSSFQQYAKWIAMLVLNDLDQISIKIKEVFCLLN